MRPKTVRGITDGFPSARWVNRTNWPAFHTDLLEGLAVGVSLSFYCVDNGV